MISAQHFVGEKAVGLALGVDEIRRGWGEKAVNISYSPRRGRWRRPQHMHTTTRQGTNSNQIDVADAQEG